MADHHFETIEPYLKRFEEAFLNNRRIAIDECLPAEDVLKRIALIELSHMELELRISRGESVRASHYFERYPELAKCDSIAADLVVTEFRACRRAAGVKEEDYFARYPTLRESLIVRFGGPVEPTIPVPGRVGRYRLQSYIGQGSFGIVYRARDEWLNRDVAVKLLIDRSPEASEQFVQEARRAAHLQHAGIVSVYDAGFQNGRGYLVMEYVAGTALSEVMKQRPISCHQAASIVSAIGRAVHYAHEQGITHRDIKPGNVLIDSNGEPRLTDFGMAAGPLDSFWSNSAELHPGDEPLPLFERQSDVHGLGTLLFILLKCDSANERHGSPTISQDLREILRVSRSTDTRQQYPTAAALSDDLARLIAGRPVSVNPPTILKRAIRYARQKPMNSILAIGSLSALFLVFSLWQIIVRVQSRASQITKTHHTTIEDLAKLMQTGGSPEERPIRRVAAEAVVRGWEDHRAQYPDDVTAASKLAYARLVAAEQVLYAGNTEHGIRYARQSWNWYSTHDPGRIDTGRAGMLLARSLARCGKTNEAATLANTIYEMAILRLNDPQWWAISMEAISFLTQLNPQELPTPIVPNFSKWGQTTSAISCGYASVGYLSRDYLEVSLNLLPIIDSTVTLESMDRTRRWERAAALTSAGESALLQRKEQAKTLLRSAMNEWNIVRPRDSLGLWLSVYAHILLVQLDSNGGLRNETIKALHDAIHDYEHWLTMTPNSRDHRYRLALCYRSIAKITNDSSLISRFHWYQKASVILHQLMEEFRDDLEYQNMYALTLHRMAVCCRMDHRPKDGLKYLEEAISIHRLLATGTIDRQKYETALKSDLQERERLQR